MHIFVAIPINYSASSRKQSIYGHLEGLRPPPREAIALLLDYCFEAIGELADDLLTHLWSDFSPLLCYGSA